MQLVVSSLCGLALWMMVSLTYAVDSTTISVVGLTQDVAMVEIQGKLRTLKIGETSPEGVTLITADSEEAVLEINGQRATYPLSMRLKNGPAPTDKSVPVVRILPDTQGMYSVAGHINGFPIDFLIDTGATNLAMSSTLAQRLDIDYQRNGKVTLSATASGIVKTYSVRLSEVKIGQIILREVEASVVEGNYPQQVLLGMSVLNRVDIRRDNRLLELRQRH